MAAAYEIVRQKKGLILLAECLLAEDILVGIGCAAAWRGCYTGMANFGLSPATLRKIETGELVFELGRYRQAGTELQKALAYDIENDYGGFIKGHLGSIGSYC